MDPSRGIIRWSAQRAHQHLQAVIVAAVGIPLAATIVGFSIALPKHPTIADRVVQAAEALGAGLLAVSLLALAYAILRAPYEQRKLLRYQLRATADKYDQIVDATQGSLVLSDVSIQREVLPENTQLTVRINFHLRFRNEADVPIEYSMREIYFNLTGNPVPISTNSTSYRIWPKASDGYLFSLPIQPPISGGFEATLEYVAWYGPVTVNDRYEQHCTYTIRDTLLVNQADGTASRFWRQSGYDKRRIEDESKLPVEKVEADDINVQVFVKSGVWKKPPHAIRAEVVLRGGGGGSAVDEDGKITPGTEGEVTVKEIPIDQLPETAQIQIGAGGDSGLLGRLRGSEGHRGYAVIITHLKKQ